MLFWVTSAAMVTAAVLALTWPLSRKAGSARGGVDADVAAYGQSLKEIEADRARGLLGEEEAEAARIEVSRRLLARVEAAERLSAAGAAPHSFRRREPVFYAIALLIPAAAMGLYLALGSPSLPDKPHAARLHQAPGKASIAELVARVEERLRAHPEDGQGWDVIAPVYLRFERYQDAAQAYRNAIRLLGETPRRLVGLGESLARARDGVVAEEARQAFQRALALEAGNRAARFWLALAKEQDGRLPEALADFQALLAGEPPEASARAILEERIAALTGRLGRNGAASPPGDAGTSRAASDNRGPDAADVTAAGRLSPAERNALVSGMVEGLANRLKQDGKDLSGWERLMRAYVVLGRRQDALEALASARRAFAGDAASLATLDSLAQSLGLESS
jgi:cytochrome c-type biogenesis protein CcmH